MKEVSSDKTYFYFSVLFLLIFLVAMPIGGFAFDVYCWEMWTVFVFNNGIGSAYFSGTNYPPLFHYLLKAFGEILGSTEAIKANMHYLKVFSLIFHLLTGYFVLRMVRIRQPDSNWHFSGTIFYSLNIAVLYNTLVWNQVDIIFTCFVFMSCYFAFKGNIHATLVFLIIALNFKIQAIIFVPVIALLILPAMIKQFSVKRLLGWILIVPCLQFLIILPFIIEGSIEHFFTSVTSTVGVISAYAFNLWYLLVPGDLSKLSDATIVHGLSYKNWGLVFFFTTSFLALFPLLKQLWNLIRGNIQEGLPLEKVLLIFALIPLLFFYFNSQMHERYSHPALAFIITYSILRRNPLPAIIASVAYFLNLEAELQFLQLPKYSTLVFDPRFVSCLWLLVITNLYLNLYDFRLKTNLRRSSSLQA